jgi:hypothetical protein
MRPKVSKEQRVLIRPASTLPPETNYCECKALEYSITNISASSLLIESVTLQFEPDMETAPNYVDLACGFRLQRQESKTFVVDVTPTPMFRELTNQIRIRVQYRIEAELDGRVGDSLVETHVGFYIIIRTPPPSLGAVFISFKQPEDQGLANILARYAGRAGFKVHVYLRKASPGAHQWHEIEDLIRSSHTMFVVWAQRTDWGEGVEREIRICRNRKLREVLMIESGVDVPRAFKDRGITYKRFDPQDPAPAFAEAVVSVRAQVLRQPPR